MNNIYWLGGGKLFEVCGDGMKELKGVSCSSDNWFSNIDSKWTAAEQRQINDKQCAEKSFIADCVRFRMDNTNEQHVYDRCKAWLEAHP